MQFLLEETYLFTRLVILEQRQHKMLLSLVTETIIGERLPMVVWVIHKFIFYGKYRFLILLGWKTVDRGQNP